MQKITSRYIIHNLIVESELRLSPLNPIEISTSKQTDIYVKISSIDSFQDNEERFNENPVKDCWIDLPGISKFHVSNGNLIEIDPYQEAKIQSVLLYLFGSIMAICLYQRGLLVLHANAIEIGDSAVLFAGDSGAGKSTTAAVFHQKGFKVLSDDLVVLNEDIMAMGGFPQIKLFDSTLKELGISSSNLTPISAQKGKFSFPITPEDSQNKRTISAIYMLSLSTSELDKKFNFTAIKGMHRFLNLIQNTYRYELVGGLDIKDQHLDLCSRLSERIHMMNIQRSNECFSAYELVDFILSDLAEQGIYDGVPPDVNNG